MSDSTPEAGDRTVLITRIFDAPLYHYAGDSPGTILCHDVAEFGGTWLVVMPDGRPAP